MSASRTGDPLIPLLRRGAIAGVNAATAMAMLAMIASVNY